MLLCAETAQKALERLKSELGPSDQPSQGRILLATVKGDIHDIGKNIVRTLLENRGYEIIDLGKNVPAEVIVEEARIQKVDLIGLSALMTTTMVEMKTTIELLRSRGLSVPVAVGGAVVTEDFAREIGAQVYAKDAAQALERIGQCLKTSDAR
jgi:5-methyltetrahydrofolate--homocysteine methyltransferase